MRLLTCLLMLALVASMVGCAAPNQAIMNQRGLEIESGIFGKRLKATGEYLANVESMGGTFNPDTKGWSFYLTGLSADQRVVEATKADTAMAFQVVLPAMVRYYEMQEKINAQTVGAISDMVGSLAPMLGQVFTARAVADPAGGCALKLPQSADEVNASIDAMMALYNRLVGVTTQPSK